MTKTNFTKVVLYSLFFLFSTDGLAYNTVTTSVNYTDLWVFESGVFTNEVTSRAAVVIWETPAVGSEYMLTQNQTPVTYQRLLTMSVYGPNGALIHSGNDWDSSSKILFKDNFERRNPYGQILEQNRLTLPSQRYNCHGFSFTRGASSEWMPDDALCLSVFDGSISSCGSSMDPHGDADIAFHNFGFMSIVHSSAYLMYSTVNGIRVRRFIGKLGMQGMYVLELGIINYLYNVPVGKQQPVYYAFS